MGEFVKMAKTTEIANNSCKRVQVGGEPVALFNLDGNYYAIHDVCTHAEASLCEGSIAGDEVLCPLHFASFNIQNWRMHRPACG